MYHNVIRPSMLYFVLVLPMLQVQPGFGAEAPPPPWIESVVPGAAQPSDQGAAAIWYDDFDAPSEQYGEASGDLTAEEALGGEGMSLELHYAKGAQGAGGRKIYFGDSPTYRNKTVRRGEQFDEVYWRIYVKHPFGWTGAPAKMSRATSLASARWAQAMIAHVWSGAGDSLTLDPASGVRDGEVYTRRYNDFDRLRWLGNRPASEYPIHATSEAGWWVCVESRAKLNTPGQKDGINQLWIDGRLACERTGLDWRGSYTGHGINAVYLEAYWNDGSPVAQSRYYDAFVVSTAPIGPVVCPRNPVLLRATTLDAAEDGGWEVEIATDDESTVWRSGLLQGQRVRVDAKSGRFVAADATELAANGLYYCRTRQRNTTGTWSGWSIWHQGFRTE